MKNQKNTTAKTAKTAKTPSVFYTLANQTSTSDLLKPMDDPEKELARLNRYDKAVRKKPIDELLKDELIEAQAVVKYCSGTITSGWPERITVLTHTLETESFRYVFTTDTGFTLGDGFLLSSSFIRSGDTVLEHGQGYTIDHERTGELTPAEVAAHRTHKLLAIAEKEQKAPALEAENQWLKAKSCDNLEEALERWSQFAGEADPKTAKAVILYAKLRSFQKVSKEMGVAKSTLTGWFNRFEEVANFSLNRPKPGENFSVKHQSMVAAHDGNKRNGKPLAANDAFTEHE